MLKNVKNKIFICIILVILSVGCNIKKSKIINSNSMTLYEKNLSDFYNRLDKKEANALVALGLAYDLSYNVIGVDLMRFESKNSRQYNIQHCLNKNIYKFNGEVKGLDFESYKSEYGYVMYTRNKIEYRIIGDKEVKEILFGLIDKLFLSIEVNIVENTDVKKIYTVDNKKISIEYSVNDFNSQKEIIVTVADVV